MAPSVKPSTAVDSGTALTHGCVHYTAVSFESQSQQGVDELAEQSPNMSQPAFDWVPDSSAAHYSVWCLG